MAPLGARRLFRDLLNQPADPLLLFLLRLRQQQQVLRRGHVVVHWRDETRSRSGKQNIHSRYMCIFMGSGKFMIRLVSNRR